MAKELSEQSSENLRKQECVNDKDRAKDKDKDIRKKLAVGAAIVATAIGANAAVDEAPSLDNYSSPAAVVQTVSVDMPMDATLPDDEDQAQQDEKKRSNIAKAISAPLYAIGYGIIKLIEILLGGVLSPLLTAIVRIVVLIGVVLAVIAICLKVAFPDVPLAKMLNKRRVISIAALTGTFGLLCEIVPLFWAEGARIVAWIRAIGGFAIVGGMGLAVAKLVRRIKARA